MLETGQIENGAAIFDPFTAAFIIPIWHTRIIIAPAPELSRVYGRPIIGGPCCLWTGWSNGKGHGVVRIKNGAGRGRRTYLHRYSYEQHNKCTLRGGEVVDHLCRNRPCFNPYHLECVTHEENNDRGDRAITQFSSVYQPKHHEDQTGLTAEDIAALTGDRKEY